VPFAVFHSQVKNASNKVQMKSAHMFGKRFKELMKKETADVGTSTIKKNMGEGVAILEELTAKCNKLQKDK
jgi:hypothetical protein